MAKGASRRSRRSLDWLNFFVADVQTGFGPFIVVYLTTQAWTEVEIGFALSLGTLTAMISQMPAGALVDSLRDKRRLAVVALAVIAVSAILLAAWPAHLPVYAARVLHGVAVVAQRTAWGRRSIPTSSRPPLCDTAPPHRSSPTAASRAPFLPGGPGADPMISGSHHRRPEREIHWCYSLPPAAPRASP